ncbi:MAG: CapA family protein [Candidatus Edwardsbacteria bacterium]|nr:CapA family protein [Candidatus Edwardsbacteria bacterium]
MKQLFSAFVFILTCQLFAQDSTRSGRVTIAAVGDVMLGGSMAATVRAKGADYPFDRTRDILTRADIAIGNLEAPFGAKGKAFKKRFTFMVPPKHAAALRNAGFDVMALANNHIMDFGTEPLKTTLSLLDSLGIGHSGAGMDAAQARKPAMVERNGVKAAFLSYSRVHPTQFWAGRKKPGTAAADPASLAADVKQAKQQAKLVVVSFHWGAELMDRPKEYQVRLAHAAIDAGADLVLGHHPHVLQGLELYKGKLIAYSLGNFAFGSGSRRCTESVILLTEFRNDSLKSVAAVPLCVDNHRVNYQPAPVSGVEGRRILKHLNAISRPFGFNLGIADSMGWSEIGVKYLDKSLFYKIK